jgi:hypothetical protein
MAVRVCQLRNIQSNFLEGKIYSSGIMSEI